MRYEDIPSVRFWKSDAFSLHKMPIDPIVAKIDELLEKYPQAFSPMAKRNLLADLQRNCEAWLPPRQKNPALDALLDIVKRRLNYIGSVAHTYEKVVCVSYSLQTGEFEAGTDVVKYQGQLDDTKDMQERVRKMKNAVNQAYGFVPYAHNNDSKTLKLFMAPEFYFRGRYGAYPPELVSQILPLLREGTDGTDRTIFKDWMFVFGTAISATIDSRHYCHTCHSADHIVFERNPLNLNKTVPKCSAGMGHLVREEVFGAIIDNVALIQKNSEDYLVTKEFMSGIDFRNTGAGSFVLMKRADMRKEFRTLPTEGSRTGKFVSKFNDERMGGSIFNMDGITFGMEICLDHAEKRLKGSENLQIVLIPSAGMEITYWRTVKDGITFNVDGLRKQGEVWLRTGQGVEAKKKNNPLKGIPGNIEVFEPLDIPYFN